LLNISGSAAASLLNPKRLEIAPKIPLSVPRPSASFFAPSIYSLARLIKSLSPLN